jgi:DNA-binding MarR family transcriptional regulator
MRQPVPKVSAAPERDSTDPALLARHTIIALMQAADAARRAMVQSLQPFDLTLPQFNVLTILLHHDELPTFQIAARMVEATPGITRLVSTLEAKGYVRRSQSKGDRRQQLCSLTAAGRRIVKVAIPPFSAAQQRLIVDFGRSDALQMTSLLQRVSFPQKTQRRAS